MPEDARRRWSAESPHLSLVGSRGLDSLQNSHDLPFRRLEPLLPGFDLLLTSGLAGQSFSRTAVRGIGQRIWQPRSSTCFGVVDRGTERRGAICFLSPRIPVTSPRSESGLRTG